VPFNPNLQEFMTLHLDCVLAIASPTKTLWKSRTVEDQLSCSRNYFVGATGADRPVPVNGTEIERRILVLSRHHTAGLQ
jgi:hypothetical protein